MANEFVARNGIIALDSSQITGSLNVSGGITGSLFGTATTASYVLNAVSASFATSASNAATASYVLNAVSASFATSASYILNAVSASFATTASYVLNAVSASFATTSSLATIALSVTGGFSKSFAIVNNNNISAGDVGTFPVWRCNVPCTASMVLGYTDAGSSVLVNATKNGSSLLSSDLSISTNTWVSSSTLQNQNFNTGDILAFVLTSFSGTPKEITIQTSFIY